MSAHLPSPTALHGAAATGVGALVLAHIGVDAVTGSVSAVLPRIVERFSLSTAGAGALVATLSASALLAQPLAGRLADRIGHRRTAVGGAVLASSLLSLLAVLDNLAFLYIAVIVGGLGSAGFHPAAASLARRVAPRHGTLAVSLFSAGGMLGLAAGPLVFVILATRIGPASTPLLMLPGVALGAVVYKTLPRDAPAPAADAPVRRHPARAGRSLVGLAAAGTAAAIAVTTFTAGVPLLLASDPRTAGDGALLGWTLALFDIGAAAGGLGAGWASRYVDPRRLASLTLLAAPVPLTYSISRADGSLRYLAAVTVAGALANAAVPLLVVAAQARSRRAVAAASGVLMGLTNGIGGLAFLGIGTLADIVDLEAALVTGFLTAVPAALIADRALRQRTPVVARLAAARSCSCTADRAWAACTVAAA